ncbi:nucleoside diphosphate kinase [Blakeslea trispora]|nr:nucleoside diphosphate kinase [Blakeslea trispora]
MLNCLKSTAICLMLYVPFLFLLLIPTNSFLTFKNLNDVCANLSIPFVCPMPSQTLLIIKPDGMRYQDQILVILQQHHFKIVRDKTVSLSKDQVDQWYDDKHDASYYPSLVSYLTERGPIRVMQLSKIEAISYLRHLIGPTDPQKARELVPHSIRALYGTNVQENAVHASDSMVSAQREFELFFL